MQISSDGDAHLPSPDGGYDDETVARFERESQIQVPGDGSGRFAARARFLNSTGKRNGSRGGAQQLAKLHHQMLDAVVAVNKDAQLHLAAATLFDHPHAHRSLRPRYPGA